jgi:hypothetical protein
MVQKLIYLYSASSSDGWHLRDQILDTAFIVALSYSTRSNTFLIILQPPTTTSICRSYLSCQQKPVLWLAAKIPITYLFKVTWKKRHCLHDSKNKHCDYSVNIISLYCFFVACQLILQSGSLSGICVTTYSGNQTRAIPHLEENYCHRK